MSWTTQSRAISLVSWNPSPEPPPAAAARTAFQNSLPLLITTFVNRVGSIGISLLPMLLVEKHFTSANSSLVMTLVKVGLLAGIFLGGWISDRLGMKPAVLLSFAVAGVGLGLLPFGSSVMWVCLAAVCAQLGQAIFYSSSRLMLLELVPANQQKEALGWLATINNLGSIFSYTLGAIFSGCGLTALFLVDAATALAAALAGGKLLPRKKEGLVTVAPAAAVPAKKMWLTFLLNTGKVASFYFLYEMFMVSTSARCWMLFGADGLRLFSVAMMVNTALCAGFVVMAARHLDNVRVIFPLSVILVGAGIILSVSNTGHRWVILLAMLVATIGEIIFTALAQILIIRSTPSNGRQGQTYGLSLALQSVARIAGAAAAFPCLVNSDHSLTFVGTSLMVILLLCLAEPEPPTPTSAC